MRQITHLPADLSQRAVQLARYIQALPPGTHVLVVNKATGATMKWEAVIEPALPAPAPDLTLQEAQPYNTDSTTRGASGTVSVTENTEQTH